MKQLMMFDETLKRDIALNPDGYSVKNCSIIYAPKGQAGEYARLACNPYTGCGHKCIYCYVPQVIKISREQFNNDVQPKQDFLKRLQKDLKKYEAAGIAEQVLLSFTTDPYNPLDAEIGLTREAIQYIHAYGLAHCTLTKGGERALRDIDLFRPERDSFATTLTSLDPAISLKWEPGAALPDERIATLKRFHEAGIFTWVSLEPVYDTAATLQIIEQTSGFVDLYKVGRINYHRLSREIDWRRFTKDVTNLLWQLGKQHYIKADLQSYLPAGYYNPLRVPQHR